MSFTTRYSAPYAIADGYLTEDERITLDQIIALDGRDAVITDSRPLTNGSGRVIGEHITITAQAYADMHYGLAAVGDGTDGHESITAELTDINRPVGGTTQDCITICRDETPVAEIWVASCEEPEPYDAAIADAGFHTYTWRNNRAL